MIRQFQKTLFIFLFIPLFLCGQQSNIRVFSTKNGLSNSIVPNIIQDKQGFLWIATEGGLSKFNGKTFFNYTVKNGLPGNNITAVCEDKQGNIWFSVFGTALVKFDGSHFMIFDKKDGLDNLDIFSIICDSKGNIWIPTEGNGIYKYDGKRFLNYNEQNGLTTSKFLSAAEDKNGNIWFGSKNKGVCKFDGKRFHFYDGGGALDNTGVFSLCFDGKGVLWMGTTSIGVYRMVNDKIEPFFISTEISGDFIGDIVEDNRENIWIGTSYGVVKYDRSNVFFYSENEGLSSNIIQSLSTDYEGNLWIGTAGSGLCVLKNEAIVTFTERDGLSSNKVTLVKQLKSGEYLIGTNGMGVNKLDIEGIDRLKNDKLLSDGVITGLYIDKNENIWLGKESSGLAVLKHINSPPLVSKGYSELIKKISNQTITNITGDKTGAIWISTFGGGVFKFFNDSIKAFGSSNGMPGNNFLTSFADSKGDVWFGTFQEGLVRYDGKNIKTYSKKDGLTDNTVWAICENEKGNLFFGTAEGGVVCFDGKSFSSISVEQGLCSDLINALLVDDKNNLWVGTDKGVNRIGFSNSGQPNSIRYYGEYDGFRSTEIAHNGMMVDNENILWIATANGLSRYNPAYDFENKIPPKLALTDIKLFYQDVDWPTYSDSIDAKTHLPLNLDLSYKNNHLTFNFQALTTNNVKYTYILENFDKNWSPQINTNEAVYSNIPPGDYTFKVKAVNSDGYWSEDEVSYSFTISPPFWRTWWFYSLASILAIVSIIGFINWRTARLEKEKRVLEEKVDERTKELTVAHNKLSYAYQDIKDSIQYAKQIQDAILPLHEDLKKVLPDSFIFFKPRDVVSGDFYWFNIKEEATYIAAVDCTGHGVPGAFMSMIGNTLLNEIINKQKVTEPALILGNLNDEVRKALKQDRETMESKDGMDLAFCSIDKNNRVVQYAGARRPLYIIKNNGTFEEIKGDKLSIGGMQFEEKTTFTNHKVQLEKGDTVYIFSDGYVDQFGGERGKKYTSKRLQELLIGICKLSMKEQYKTIKDTLTTWTGDVEQIDDILVIGIRL